MDYLKQLEKFDLGQADIDHLADTFEQRAKQAEQSKQARILYESAAMDLALGAIEMYQDTEKAIQEKLSPKQWLSLLSGVNF